MIQGLPLTINAIRKSGRLVTTLASALLAIMFIPGSAFGQGPALDVPRGLRVNTDRAAPGYVLFSPGPSGITYLIDNDGQVVHRWRSDYGTGHGLYLRDNGNLVRAGQIADHDRFMGGQGGQLQAFTWDGELIWDYRLANDEYLLHHDFALMPNGNILAVAVEIKTPEEASAAGRRPDLISGTGLWSEVLLELEPRGDDDARVVWEWRVWDHYIQDFDPSADNYGMLDAHPERADINADGERLTAARKQALLNSDAAALLDTETNRTAADNMHVNAVSYNAELDQAMISVHGYGEIWIIDHSTTTEEAAGSTGGRYGKGGDLLYRWGNPGNYGRGDGSPRQLFQQHHPRWTEAGLPGEGNVTLFNNNFPGPTGAQSVVFELELPMNEDGTYEIGDNGQYGPERPSWVYMAPNGRAFHAPFISGAHRLSNGHTFVNSGPQGRFFEVTPAGEIVWEYWNPYSGEVSLPHHELLVEAVAPWFYMAFRAIKMPPDHPALEGRDLRPLDPQPPAIPHPPQN